MTTASDHTAGSNIPTWTTSDRLRKARMHAGLGQEELADAIGVSRNSISNYETGVTQPRRIVLNAWSVVTGVPRDWLETGESPPATGDDGGRDVRHQGLEPRTRWLTAVNQTGVHRMRVYTSDGWIVVDEDVA